MQEKRVPRVVSSIKDTILVDTEVVGKEVGHWKCLWNPKHASYKNKYVKQRAWQQVTANIVHDFYTRSTLEQREIVRAVQLRWKTARDAYIKCKMKQSQGTYRYRYYDTLKFLDRINDDEDNNSSSESSSANDEETDPPETDTKKIHQPETDTIRTHQPETNMIRIHPPETSTTRTHPLETEMSKTQTQILNKRRVMKSQESPSDSTATTLQADDVAFFNSLAPILNELDSYKKLVFRARIMELAVDVAGLRSTIKQDPDAYIKESET